MRNRLLLFLSIILLLSTNHIYGQKSNLPELSDDAVFSLVTCTPGNDLYNQFGHSAIRLRDQNLGLDFVYNYGTFNFETPNFVLKFIERKLMYTLSKSYFRPFLNELAHEGRGVSEQKIILDSVHRQKLFEILETNYLPNNREYLYDFFYDNCATKIRDVFGKVGDLKVKEVKSEKTFRTLLDEYLYHDPWLNFGIYLILGLEADKKTNSKMQMFLPDYLSTNFEKSKLNGSEFMEQTVWILPKPAKKNVKQIITPLITFSVIFLIGILTVYLKKERLLLIWEISCLTLFSLAGLFLLFMWLGTDHIATQKNLNVLWANPFFILWVFTAYRKKLSNFAKYIGYLLLLSNAFVLIMFLVPFQHFNLAVLPLVLLSSTALCRVLFINKFKNEH
jgi:hypothetical protein